MPVTQNTARTLLNKLYIYRTEIKPGKHSDSRMKNKAVAFGQWPRPLYLHNRYTRTGTCFPWGMAVTSVT